MFTNIVFLCRTDTALCYQSLMNTNIYTALPKIQAVIVGYINNISHHLQPTLPTAQQNDYNLGAAVSTSHLDDNTSASLTNANGNQMTHNFLSITVSSQPGNNVIENIKT